MNDHSRRRRCRVPADWRRVFAGQNLSARRSRTFSRCGRHHFDRPIGLLATIGGEGVDIVQILVAEQETICRESKRHAGGPCNDLGARCGWPVCYPMRGRNTSDRWHAMVAPGSMSVGAGLRSSDDKEKDQ